MSKGSMRTNISIVAALLAATALAAAPAAAAKPTASYNPFACTSIVSDDDGNWGAVQIGLTWANAKVTRTSSTITTALPVAADVLTRSGTFAASSRTTSWVAFHAPLKSLQGDGTFAATRVIGYRLEAWNGKNLVVQIEWNEATGSALQPC